MVAVTVGPVVFNTVSYNTYNLPKLAGVVNVAVPVVGYTEPVYVLLPTVIALFDE